MTSKKVASAVLLISWVLGGLPVAFADNNVLDFDRPLYRGIRGEDVTALQKFLAADKNIYPEGLITGYFGPLTEAAVQRWQAAQGIVSSGDPVSTGYGRVGPLTRAKLTEVTSLDDQKPETGNQQPAAEEPEAEAEPTKPEDTTTPVIDESTIKATGISSTAATISWTTDELSDSVVRFTNDQSCASDINESVCPVWNVSSEGKTTSHLMVVSGLISQSTYHYEVSSSDAAGNKATGPVQFFMTVTSSNSPILPDLKVESIKITPSSPTVRQLATVEFRLTNPSRLAKADNFVLDIVAGTTKGASGITYKNLTHDCPNDIQPFGSCDVKFDLTYFSSGKKSLYVTVDPRNLIPEDNESNNSLGMNFEVMPSSTNDNQPPTVTLSVSEPEATRVFAKFSSDEDALVVYQYGLTDNYGDTHSPWKLYVAANSDYIENLSPSTTYYVRAKATDWSGNVGYSADHVFITPASTPKPTMASEPIYEAGILSWTTSVPCDGKISYGLTTDYGNVDEDKNASGHSVALSNLVPNAAYQYKIECSNSAGSTATINDMFSTARLQAEAETRKGWLASAWESLIDFFASFLPWF